MTAEVEQRIVEMRFDNEQFEKGAKQTLGTLNKLDAVLDMLGEGGMDKLSSALDSMEYRFSRLGIAGAAAIQNITGKVMNLASNLLTAIPDQIIQGGTQRALNIENAKFQLKGLGIAWEEVADDIDHAVMGTAYGVDEAAKAAAILGASNVQYKNAVGEISDMGHVLRSISGIAAMTNSSYEDIANVMGDIFAMGRVTNGELQRFELRGLNVVAKLAEMSQNGTLKKIGSDAKYTETELRELISKGGMDALTFAKAMDTAFGEHATAANETYTGSLRNMKAALSRIGADFVTPLHEGERKIMLALRGAFDRVRQVTKPFAEGKFSRIIDLLTDKFVKLADSVQFDWLENLFGLIDKANFNPLSELQNDLAAIKKEISNYGVDINKTIFGNIDTNHRQRLEWTTENLNKFKDELRSWNISAKEIEGSLSTVLGMSKNFDGLELAFSPILQTSDGPKLLSEKTVDKYIWALLENLRSRENGWHSEDLFALDANGIEIDGQLIQGLIADIGDTAIQTGKAMHYVGKDGALALAAEEAKKASQQFNKLPSKLKVILNVASRILSVVKDFSFSMIGRGVKNLADITGGRLLTALNKVYGAAMRFEDSRFRNFLFNQVGPKLEAIGNLLKSLGNTAWATGNVIFAIFSRIFKSFRDKGLFGSIGNGAQGFIELATRISDKLGDWLTKLADLIKNGPSAESSLGKIGHGFELVGNFIGGTINAISTFLRYILGLQKGETVFTKFGETAKKVGGFIRTAFGTIRTAIQTAFGEGGIGKEAIKAAAGLYTVLIGYRNFENKQFAFGRLGKAFEFLKDIITKSYESIRAINPLQWADDIETLLRRTSGALRAFADNLNAKSLLTIGGAVIALAFGLSILAAVDQTGQLIPALRALAGVMALLLVSFAAIKAITDQGLFKNITAGWKGLGEIFKNSIAKYMNAISLKETATAMLIFSAAVGVLALAVVGLGFAFSKLKLGDIALAVVTVGALTALLTGMLVWITKATKGAGGGKLLMIGVAMAAMALAIGLLAAVVVGLSYAFQKLNNVWSVIGAVMAVGAMLIGLAGTLAFLTSILEKVPIIKILAVSAAMVLMAGAVLIVAAAAIGFAAAMQMSEKWWHVLATIGGTLIVVAAALAVLSLLGPKVLIAAAAIVAVGFAIKLMADGFFKVSEAMVVLSGALNMLPADGSLEVIGKGLGKVAGGLAKLAGATILMPKKSEDIYNSLVPLATAMTVFRDVDIAKLVDKKTGLPALSDALRDAFGGHFFGLFGSLGSSMGFGSAGLLAAGPALLSLGEGLQAMTPGLQAFSSVQNPEAMADTLKELAFAVSTLSADASFGNRDYLANLADNLMKIADAISGLSADQVDAIRGLGSALNDAFTDSSGQAVAALQTELNDLQRTLETGSEQFIIVARRFPMHIQSGIEDNTSIAVNAMKAMIWEMCSAANSDEVKNNLKIIGGNITIGIANGITSRTAEAAAAMRNLASALQTSFTVSLQIRSPSRLFEHLAEYVPQGAARGIQNGIPGVTDAMSSMVSVMENSMDNARNFGTEFSPRVTPVMDLANYRRSMAYADQMFQMSPMANMRGFSGLTVNGDAISYNMQNRDVVSEIKQMSNKINRLGEAIEKMQIVMDTGVLVGQLTPGINSELGVMAIREGRQ